MAKNRLLFLSLLATSLTAFSQNNYKEISLLQLAQQTSKTGKPYVILDVRTPGEYMDTNQAGVHIGIGRIKNSVNVPLQDLLQKPETIGQLEKYKDQDVYVICSHSYRSRRISNLLLEKGFSSVNNVQGGMTEWYRNYDLLQPYRASMFENNIAYGNMAASQLFKKLKNGEAVEIIGFKNPPRQFFDSLMTGLYTIFPEIRNAQYYTPADSLQILEKVKAGKNKTFVFFNMIGSGAAETANWLAQKGYNNVFMLIGNVTWFFEYLANYQPASLAAFMTARSKIDFYTPLSFCRNAPANVRWIDLRHDTTFNQVTKGTKLDYRTLKGAVNFPFYKPVEDFEKQFPDKSSYYMLIPQDGYRGVELAETLSRKGYSIGWLFGGIERWEWYSNNIGEFTCTGQFIQ